MLVLKPMKPVQRGKKKVHPKRWVRYYGELDRWNVEEARRLGVPVSRMIADKLEVRGV